MSFPTKKFQNNLYSFNHLVPFVIVVPLNANGTTTVQMKVEFGHHCFTEDFDSTIHGEHHKYHYQKEVRAFDLTRYQCSLQLPQVIAAMLSGKIYRSAPNYTYTAKIQLATPNGIQDYSIFFDLYKTSANPPALRMFVKSAYLKPSVGKANVQSWRFISLAGQKAGVFSKQPKTKPKKK